MRATSTRQPSIRYRLFALWAVAAVAFIASLYDTRTAYAADTVPFKLFDAHAHLISPDKVRYPRAAPPAGPIPLGSMPPGAGAIPGGAPTSPRVEPSVEELLASMDANGVEGGVAVQRRGSYGTDNRYILDSVDAHKDRLVPVVVLDAQETKTPDQLRDLIKAHGISGLRITGFRSDNGSFPWLDSEQALKAWAVADEAGLAVVIMTTPPGKSPEAITGIKKLAGMYPHVRIVLDHVAWPNAEGGPDYGIDEVHRTLALHKNVYYKVTTINFDVLREAKLSSADFVRRVVDVYGADHVMWGSDIGNSAGSYKQMVQGIVSATAKLTDAEKRAVMHDTGKLVFVRGGTIGLNR